MNKIHYRQIKFRPNFGGLPLKKLFIASFVLNTITIILGLASRFILPPEMPLFYGLPKTAEQIVPSSYIVLPATTAFLFSFLNIFLSINISGTYLKKTLAFASISISLLSLIGTLKIIFLIGNI